MSFDRKEFRSKLCEIPLPVEEIACLAEFFTAHMEAEIASLKSERDALRAERDKLGNALANIVCDYSGPTREDIIAGQRVAQELGLLPTPSSGEPARKP